MHYLQKRKNSQLTPKDKNRLGVKAEKNIYMQKLYVRILIF